MKVKVAHIITRFIQGGAQENTLATVEGLRRKGFEVDLITGPPIGPEGSLLEEAKERGIEPIIVPALRREVNPFFDIPAFFHLYKLISRGEYDIVHTHSSKAGILGRVAANLAGVPVVVHTIHGLPFFPYQKEILNWLYVNLERFAAGISDALITVCDAMRKQALSAHVGREEQFVTIYSGMELDAFSQVKISPAEAKRALGIDEKLFVVGKIARLFHLKGHEFLIEAAGEILKQGKDVCFLVVGGGILEESLKEEVKRRGIDRNFVFTGLLERGKIPEVLRAMDVLVHCSLREGLPRVIVQAMASGVPVVCFDIDGAREIVEDGENGFLVGPASW